MKIFHCQNCQNTVFFENTNCNACGHALAYLPDVGTMAALEPKDDGLWQSLVPDAADQRYRLCANYLKHQVCNWAVDAKQDETLCLSCRLTQVLPNLDTVDGLDAWRKLETAKRRLIYSLLQLRLPLVNRQQDAERGLAFEFLSDDLAPSGPVLTGHDDGLITINVAEADDLEREKRRLSLHEPYRTLLGHFRHEVGHYYWDVLIKDSAHLDAFRAVFGDEREDYAEALQRHYQKGENGDTSWMEHFVSSYASSHSWEDWAETWAHYLHMADSLETAAACGLSLKPRRRDEPTLERAKHIEVVHHQSFQQMIDDWLSLTYALNNLSRSLGQPDSYPFTLSVQSIAKLSFVHDTIQHALGAGEAPTQPSAVQAHEEKSEAVAA